MLKIGLASAVLILICLGAVAHTFGNPWERRGAAKIAGQVPAVRGSAGNQQSVEAYPVLHRDVIWHPDPTGANPFGFIPPEWTTRPQLLPLTWEVRTVYAADDTAETKTGRGDFSPRVKIARVD
jgi:hypothetical protein